MERKRTILSYMPEALQNIFEELPPVFFDEIQEIRLRVQKPVVIRRAGAETIIDYCPAEGDIAALMEMLSDYSLYAYEEELRSGYLTLPGGHRVGVTGRAVVEGGMVKTLKHIGAVNIRIAHEIKGCANGVMGHILEEGAVCHSMIISPPGCGKTTLLRDIVRQLSNGGKTVGVVDERSEIAGCYRGIAQNDLGPRTDVLDGCPKEEGMRMLLRSMGPQVIAVDEIGRQEELGTIEQIINSGVKLICTVHGKSLDELRRKPVLSTILQKKIFERFIVLDKPGKIAGIYNEGGVAYDT